MNVLPCHVVVPYAQEILSNIRSRINHVLYCRVANLEPDAHHCLFRIRFFIMFKTRSKIPNNDRTGSGSVINAYNWIPIFFITPPSPSYCIHDTFHGSDINLRFILRFFFPHMREAVPFNFSIAGKVWGIPCILLSHYLLGIS